jgi:hypothetical protein
MSFTESIIEAVPGVGIALGGAIAAMAGPRVALAVAAAGSLGIAVLAWVMLRPSSVERGKLAPTVQANEAPSNGLVQAASRDQ